MSNGVQKLGSLLRTQMHAVSQYNIGGGSIVFGKITSGRGLKIDGLDYTIPRSDYLIVKSCSEDLSVGNRVLVGVYNQEPVVIGILV